MTEWVQHYGKDTDIPMSRVLLLEAQHKMTVVTHLYQGVYRELAVQWPLKYIMSLHGETIIRLSRDTLVAMKDLKKLELAREGWEATVVGWDGEPRTYHVSRRCKPMVNRYLKGRDAATSTA